jgi:hypothetical protein
MQEQAVEEAKLQLEGLLVSTILLTEGSTTGFSLCLLPQHNLTIAVLRLVLRRYMISPNVCEAHITTK